jgi:hypothetical protein
MRVVGPLVGVALGAVLGFGVHALITADTDVGARLGADRVRSREAAPSGLPAPRAPAPEPVVIPDPSPIGATAVTDAGSSAGAAADALVGILVHGAVIDTNGRAVPPADWGISFDDDRGEPQRAKVGPSSTYAMSGLTPGRWTVRCRLQGYRGTTRTLELSAAQPVVRLDLVLEPAVVLLIKAFTPAGQPLLEAIKSEMAGGESWNPYRIAAIATREPPPAALPEISERSYESWDIGSYSDRLDSWRGPDDTPSDAMGKLELDGALPAYVSVVFRHIVLQTQLVEPGTTEVVFVVSIPSLQALLGAVKLRVVSADTKQPVPGMTAALSDSQTSGGGDKPDAAGNFLWEQQRPGRLELEVRAADHETLYAVVSVQPGATTDLGTLELTSLVAVRGRVVDAAGNPVALNLRALIDDPIGGRGMGERSSFKSNAEGAYESYGLGRHRYHVSISSDQWAALPVPVDLSNGDVEGLVITVVPGMPVRLIPRWESGQRYGVRVTSEEGSIASDARAWDTEWTWFKRLPPGRYEVALIDEGRMVKRLPLVVADTPVALELKP